MNDTVPPSPNRGASDDDQPRPPLDREPQDAGCGGPDHEIAVHALRAALRYFEERLQSQEAQLSRLRNALYQSETDLAACRAALQQATETARPANMATSRHRRAAFRYPTGGGASRPAFPGARTLGRVARELRRMGRKLRRLLARAMRGSALHTPPVDPNDYRVRMRGLLASGNLGRTRTVTVVAPERLHRAASVVTELLASMSLASTLRSTMPGTFDADLYVVLSPRRFDVLPPPDRRILWLVEPNELARGNSAADHARLSASLAVFEAIQPRSAELLACGLVQHQIFHVPLAPLSAPEIARADRSPMGLPHMLARALHGCGIIDDARFEAATAQTRLDAAALVLCLPEAPERFAHARESLRHGATLFPGLRHVDGWKGTALSYRYLARRAVQAGHGRLIVWEDDAWLPPDFDVRLPALLAQLEAAGDGWDLFSGLITDLSPQGRIESTRPYGDDLLIEIDTVVGMVFGIYGPKALRAMADYRIDGEDIMKATIDRYLETLGLRCCTLFPPLVGHAEHLPSSLWAPAGQRFLSNDTFNAMIDGSQLRLLSKVADSGLGSSRRRP